MRALSEIWHAYARWLKSEAPELLLVLNQGASAAELDEIEKTMNRKLPISFRQLYGICDGQRADTRWLFPEGEWLPLKRIIQDYKGLVSNDSDWRKELVPFLFDGGSGYLAVECGENGGEIYDIWFEEGSEEKIACSLEDWLGGSLTKAEEGKLYFDKISGITEQ